MRGWSGLIQKNDCTKNPITINLLDLINAGHEIGYYEFSLDNENELYSHIKSGSIPIYTKDLDTTNIYIPNII